MYKLFTIILIISHYHASSYAANVGLDGALGLGGTGPSSLGPIQLETPKRNFDVQQNLLYKDPNLKQTFNVPASDFPIKVLFNRQNQNGVMIQEQQIPKLLENVLNANPQNDRPVVVGRQDLGNILVPYGYFVQQSPQTQQAIGQQAIGQQVIGQQVIEQQQPQLIVEQPKPASDQSQLVLGQNQPVLNQRIVNISPLVIGQRDPNSEQRQPNLGLTQPDFEREGIVVDRRQPIIFNQRLPADNRNPTNAQQTDTEQKQFTLNASPQNTQNLPVNDQRQKLIFEQLSHFIGQSQPLLQQGVAQQDSTSPQRQQFFIQLQPENTQNQPDEEQPSYRELPVSVQSSAVSNADVGSTATNLGLGWNGESMTPELSNTAWWRSGKIAEARAQMAKYASF